MVAPAIALGAAGIGLGGIGSAVGSYMQQQEAEAAREEAARLAEMQGLANSQTVAGADSMLAQGGQAANQALLEGLAGAGANIQAYGNLARDDFSQGMGQARSDLMGGMSAAGQAYSPLTQFLGYGQQAGGLLGSMAGQDPRQNWQQDPGYQFRQQQGEQAIGRAASAMGGRASGRTLKDLTSFNQDLASQEYGNAVNRGFQQQAQQMGVAGQLAGLGGIGANAQGQLAGMLYGGGQGLAGLGQNYAQGMSGLASNMGSNLGNLGWQGGQALSNSLWGQQQARSNTQLSGMGAQNALTNSLIGQTSAAVPYAGGPLGSLGNTLTNLGSAGIYSGMTDDGSGYSGYGPAGSWGGKIASGPNAGMASTPYTNPLIDS